MKKSLVILAAVVLVAFGSSLVYARSHGPRGMHADGAPGVGPFGRLERLQKELNLSDAQVDQIKAVFTDLRTQNASYRDQLQGGREAIAQALINNPNDVAGAQALLDQQTAAETAMKHNALVAFSKALNVLTADQRAQLGTLLADRAERHRR